MIRAHNEAVPALKNYTCRDTLQAISSIYYTYILIRTKKNLSELKSCKFCIQCQSVTTNFFISYSRVNLRCLNTAMSKHFTYGTP